MRSLYFFLLFALFPLLHGEDSSKEKLEERLNANIHPSKEGNRVGKIKIDNRSSGITESTWIYVKHALDYYKKNPPLFLILELNTPGGEVFTAEKISDALKEMDTQYNVPVIAFINNWAISAGAMLAYSSRFIAVVKDASMGAAEPVLQDTTSGELKTASEKVNSALRSDFANRANFFDRNPDIAEAMVDKDLILVQRGEKILKLDTENQIQASDKVISPKGKLLTLNASQLMDYGVADIYLPPAKLPLITEEEREKGIWPGDKELLFQYPFFKGISNAFIDEYQMDWKTLFLSLLANPIVTSILFLGLMLGFYMEINTPGFGFPGILALSCLFLLTLSSFALEIGDFLELILMGVGVIVLLIDFFWLPTFGLLGIIGAALFLIGFFGLLLPGIGSIEFELDTQTFNAAGEAFFNRLVWLFATFLAGLGLIALLARFIHPRFSAFKRFVLEGNEQEGYIASLDPKHMPKAGTPGVAISPLRPSGKVEIEGKIYDAMSTGQLIEQGAKIVVLRYEETTLFVREI